MRGHAPSVGSVDIFVRAVLEEFPELDAARVRAALERGVARAASASLDTEGYRVVDLHLARVDINDDGAAARLSAMAEAWQRVERPYYAADCFERVLLIKPADKHANES